MLLLYTRPLHPQTQGKEERFHRTLKSELLQRVSIKDLAHAQTEFDIFRKIYNEERPHCSLNYAVPADCYIKSVNEMPEKIEEWEYPESYMVKWVRNDGYIHLRKNNLFLSEAFCGLKVALVEKQEDGFVDIIYRNFKIATIDLKCGYFVSKKITR